jgi:hypothetical protein
MNDLEYANNGSFTPQDIEHLNTEYRDIHDLLSILREKTEFVEEVRKSIPEITYIPENQDTRAHTTNVYYLPNTGHAKTEIRDSSAHEGVVAKNNIIPIQQPKRVAPHIRKHLLQNEVFDKNGEILSNQIITKKREKMAQVLRDDPISAHLYKWDCLAANDEKTPHTELSDTMVSHAIQSAKQRKDGALIQAIKNNLIQTAANEESLDPNIATSPLLADHIANISPSHPIILRTVEFPVFQITAIKTVDYGDQAYYKARVMLAGGEKKTFLMLAGGCTV